MFDTIQPEAFGEGADRQKTAKPNLKEAAMGVERKRADSR